MPVYGTTAPEAPDEDILVEEIRSILDTSGVDGMVAMIDTERMYYKNLNDKMGDMMNEILEQKKKSNELQNNLVVMGKRLGSALVEKDDAVALAETNLMKLGKRLENVLVEKEEALEAQRRWHNQSVESESKLKNWEDAMGEYNSFRVKMMEEKVRIVVPGLTNVVRFLVSLLRVHCNHQGQRRESLIVIITREGGGAVTKAAWHRLHTAGT